MSFQSVSITDLLSVCVEAAQRACKKIREIRACGDLAPIEKGDGTDALTGRPMADTQTEADRQSERVIFSIIRRSYPDIRIIGEEQSSSSFESDDDLTQTFSPRCAPNMTNHAWTEINSGMHAQISELSIFVDPLDGTSEFINNRLHCVSVLIGIAKNGRRLAGVIARPFPDDVVCPQELMYGIVGAGVFIDGKRLVTPLLRTANSAIRVTTTLRRSNKVTDKFFELVPCEIIKEGGAGWKLWLVAIGKADCYQYARPGTKKWDVLAGDAILSALGGVITDACGRPLTYAPDCLGNDWGIMASLDKELHYKKFVPASHRALVEAAADITLTHWPAGLQIPSLILDASL
jgi:3'(2'), 5'-bisphosphate nucleotidase